MTATTEFLDDTVNAVQTKTIIEISRNETLSMSKTDNKTESILDYITSKLCQNNCSKNGECRSGRYLILILISWYSITSLIFI